MLACSAFGALLELRRSCKYDHRLRFDGRKSLAEGDNMGIWKNIFGRGRESSSEIPSEGTAPRVNFEATARRAMSTRQTVQLEIVEVYPLICDLEKALLQENPKEQDAFRRAYKGMTLECPTCGEFDEQVTSLIGMSGANLEDHFETIVAVGTSGTLLEGRCPGCGGSAITASFGPFTTGDKEAESIEVPPGPQLDPSIVPRILRSVRHYYWVPEGAGINLQNEVACWDDFMGRKWDCWVSQGIRHPMFIVRWHDLSRDDDGIAVCLDGVNSTWINTLVTTKTLCVVNGDVDIENHSGTVDNVIGLTLPDTIVERLEGLLRRDL